MLRSQGTVLCHSGRGLGNRGFIILAPDQSRIVNMFSEFADQSNYDTQQDLVGLAVYWISACNGYDAVPISEVHDILTLYDFNLSDQTVATRIQQLKDEGLVYYRERSGTYSGFQLTIPGFERYDELSGGCPGMNERGSGEPEETEETEEGQESRDNVDNESANNSYDVFISHAGEDKDPVARPLANELRDREFDVWFDEFELQIGDRLRRSIDDGLANSNHGIIILSEAYFGKQWPEEELEGLMSRENDNTDIILPLWYGVGEKEVTEYSPMLSGRVAGVIDEDNVDRIAESLSGILRD